MTGATKRIILIVMGTILLPIILFVVYDISSLQDDEEMIQAVYENQLDFVIFSANQYSNDFLQNMVTSVEEDLNGLAETGLSAKTQTLLGYSGCSLLYLRQVDSLAVGEIILTYGEEEWGKYIKLIERLHHENQNLIKQLVAYKLNDYTKIQPEDLITVEGQDLQTLFAMLQRSDGTMVLMTGLIHPATFATEVLSPRLQQVAQQDLVISLMDEKKDTVVYATSDIRPEVIAAKPMWLFPSLQLGISLKNQSLENLVGQRLQYNLIASGILVLLLLVGLAMVGHTTSQQIKLAQTKSDFVSNVSHELRTPLALISMFAETLLLGRVKEDKKKYEYIEIIYKETNRLTRIVNRILNFQQVEANRKKYHFVNLDINHVVDELLHDYSFHLEQNGFDFEVQLDDSLETVMADKESIYEVLVNLMDNAIKYSKDDKFIGIKTIKTNGNAIIEVSDRGIGIPREKVDQIFDKFYRVTEGDVHNVQGAGLGLSLVSSIMEAHGGEVSVRSEVGKGSTFSLIFNLN